MPTLAHRNAHPRDHRILLDEDTHVYKVDGQPYPISVSGVVQACFPHFDASSVLDKCYPAWLANKKSRYYPLINYIRYVVGIGDDEGIKAEIAKSWTANGKDKSAFGTGIHRAIELWLNDQPSPDPPSVEFHQFTEWRATHPSWEPYRTEWSIFHEDYGVAGQIDSIWVDRDTGLFHMVDWKVVQEMSEKNDYKEMGYPPMQDFPNTNLYHYILQQNLYKHILETKYGFSVESMRLVQLHQTIGAAVEWPMMNIQDRVSGVMERIEKTTTHSA